MKSQAIKMMTHALALMGAVWLAFLLRFDFRIPNEELPHLYLALAMFLPVKLAVFYGFDLYNAWWRLVGFFDLVTLSAANAVASVVTSFAAFAIAGRSFPRSVYILDLLLCFLFGVAIRLAVRFYCDYIRGSLGAKLLRKDVLIYGAGEAGIAMAKETRRNVTLGYRCVGFLDDNPHKGGVSMLGVRVLGGGNEAAPVIRELRRRGIDVSEIIIAMPSATSLQLRRAKANCQAAGVPVKIVPGMQELLTGNVGDKGIRDLRVDELLGREPVRLDETAIREELQGMSVLVTGGAGSIGSELCRQIAAFGPRSLVVYDQAESDLFMIDRELRAKFPLVSVIPVVGDICDADHMERVLREHQLESVYHAAAYKHVPLMETNVLEAVRNNVLGTFTVARAAQRNGVKRFLMISSDKAVNPTSIMGITKRVAEIMLSAMPLDGSASSTTFVSVRFGNVLGSKGSVVPIFDQQIAAGGPVTVTHPEMRRYFMTIPEAVQLVLQASTMGRGLEVFVLDMGEPIKIVDLARDLIRLAGLVPDEDIEVRFTGMREGEKLFEEIQLEGEDILPTFHEKIKSFRTTKLPGAVLNDWLTNLNALLSVGDSTAVVDHLRLIVPEYSNSKILPQRELSTQRLPASAS